ncbi:MAG: hypothetical protein WD552_00450 [Candidatus Paceibacterota bacterium]
MENLSLPLLVFFILLTSLVAVWFVYSKQRRCHYILPDWFCGIMIVAFGCVLTFFTGNIFHYFTDPPGNLHYLVSGVVWLAFVAIIYFVLENSKSKDVTANYN